MAIKKFISGLMSRKILFGATVGAALFFMIVGIVFWGGFHTAMEATNTLVFCTSCHEMKNNVFEEYKGTVHYNNRSGVRATCSDCHVPDPWAYKVMRKIRATKELYHKVLGTIDTPEKFDQHRLRMAKRVWATMKNSNSRECRNCHEFASMNPEDQKKRARRQHVQGMQAGNTCIDCHKGIVHTEVHDQLSEEEREELSKPDPDNLRPIPPQWQAYIEASKKRVKKKLSAGTPGTVELSEVPAVKIPAASETGDQPTVKKSAVSEKSNEPVAEMPAVSGMEHEQAVRAPADIEPTTESVIATVLAPVAAETAPAASLASGTGIDWSTIEPAEITLFYPGQASMEWALKGSDHGGKRAFMKGDRCLECHEEEELDIGDLIVSGEILEPTPIPDKRGSIPVSIQAAHDGEYLYMRFQWEDSGHVPVPFVDGGKMDPDNQMKLALMLAIDNEADPKVEYAERAGCWQSCHHDANDMPHRPDDLTLASSPLSKRLDFSNGITKYLKESRTSIEIEGKDGKMRGGWDKLKGEAEIQAALANGSFMDLLRYKSGSGEAEDGYVLSERVMKGGQGVSFSGGLGDDGNWVIEMKRKLTSDQPGDISMSLDQWYNIGFAIHDDYSNSRFHHVSLGLKLGFDDDGAEINAIGQ